MTAPFHVERINCECWPAGFAGAGSTVRLKHFDESKDAKLRLRESICSGAPDVNGEMLFGTKARSVDRAARAYLTVIARRPEAVVDALAS
jgi:hypothetical protein